MMNKKTFAAAAALALGAALWTRSGDGAATSGPQPRSASVAAGRVRVPVPADYRASLSRRDDGGPETVVLDPAFAARENAPKLDAGAVRVDVVPWNEGGSAEDAARRLEPDLRAAGWTDVRRLDGTRFPAVASTAPGRVRVTMMAPGRLIRISSTRWTSAFDDVAKRVSDAD